MLGQTMNKRLGQKQDGATAAGWLIIASVVVFFIYVTIRLLPAYMEYFNIKSSMESLKEQPAQMTTSKNIKKLLQRRFDFNNIESIKATEFVITNEGASKKIAIEYDKTVPLFGNISALLKFQHEEPLQ